MITESQNKALLTVGKAIADNKKWAKYAQYCFDREKGLRKEAFRKLNEFLKTTENWTEEEKIKFVKFLLPFCEDIPDADYGPFPQPLREKLIKPTLEKWCVAELNDSNSFRWYGKYFSSSEHLTKALKLNPRDNRAREILLGWGISHLWYSTHHLSEGYIGKVLEDLKLIDELTEHIFNLTSAKLQEFWTQELKKYAELVRNYAEWKESGHSNLETWGEENHKRISSEVQIYYYDK